MDDGVVDGGVGHAEPSDGVGVGGFELVEVDALIGGLVAVASGFGAGVGDLLVILLSLEAVKKPDGKYRQAGHNRDACKKHNDLLRGNFTPPSLSDGVGGGLGFFSGFLMDLGGFWGFCGGFLRFL